MVRPRVLVVEDEAVTADAVCGTLEARGFEVSHDFSGEAALGRISGGAVVDIVLMDIELGPGHIDGGAAARLITERHKIPVLFYSGYDDRDTLAKTRESDSYGYVRKDGRSSEYLVRSLNCALSRHAAEAELERDISAKAAEIKETHHRIKNGLAMVGSFLQIKQRELGGACDLGDVAARIDSLARLHDLVSTGASTRYVDAGRLLDRILSQTFRFAPVDVCHTLESGTIVLRYEEARVLGLILTEFAINAVKHSFSADDHNQFAVTLQETGHGGVRLDVAVSGFPIDEGKNLENSGSQGFRLLRALLRQLEGSLAVTRAPSPRFVVQFRPQQPLDLPDGN